ncbi:MAG TPA: hypothetical protein VMR41_04645 [Patescibacteria group bacterium]|nr:hypothetical protein [Patescibacteria group bacterium]
MPQSGDIFIRSPSLPTSQPQNWVKKQQIVYNDMPTQQGIKHGMSILRRAPPLLNSILNNKFFPRILLNESKDKSYPEILTELYKEEFKQKESIKKRILGAVTKSQRIMLSLSSIFPLDLFPSSLIIDETKLTIIYRDFFASARIHQVDIKDVSNVFVEYALCFATLKIVSRTFVDNVMDITNLYKKDAMRAKSMIEGLRMFINENIDTSMYETEELCEKISACYDIGDKN